MTFQSCYPDKAPQMSQLLDILSHSIRREIIHFFENHTDSRTAPINELVSHITNRVPAACEEELEIELFHTHLPKLAHADWLTYDPRSGDIRYYGHDHVEDWLRDLYAIFYS
ncbi:DUF7344 domain-containing protein [Halobellus salinisoli]|uniref:DUF7344 domain-containing protein n=1 Tax=Halobellus salinisoli TaxID=3108500 RepID=UPI003008D5D6